MFSTGFNSGARAGNSTSVRLSGTTRSLVQCHPARSISMTPWAPGATACATSAGRRLMACVRRALTFRLRPSRAKQAVLLARVRSWGQPPMGPPGSGSETPGLVRGPHAGGVYSFSLKGVPPDGFGRIRELAEVAPGLFVIRDDELVHARGDYVALNAGREREQHESLLPPHPLGGVGHGLRRAVIVVDFDEVTREKFAAVNASMPVISLRIRRHASSPTCRLARPFRHRAPGLGTSGGAHHGPKECKGPCSRGEPGDRNTVGARGREARG